MRFSRWNGCHGALLDVSETAEISLRKALSFIDSVQYSSKASASLTFRELRHAEHCQRANMQNPSKWIDLALGSRTECIGCTDRKFVELLLPASGACVLQRLNLRTRDLVQCPRLLGYSCLEHTGARYRQPRSTFTNVTGLCFKAIRLRAVGFDPRLVRGGKSNT